MNANRFDIAAPIWNSGKRCVGLNAARLNCDTAEVNIRYIDKLGKRIYPQLFTISAQKAKTYPTQVVRGGVELHIIPIVDLSEKSLQSQVITKPAKVCNVCGGQEFYNTPASELSGKSVERCARCHPKPKGLETATAL